MTILLTEYNDYSATALSIYRSLSPIILGLDNIQDRRSVEGMVVRLGLTVDGDFIDQFPSLKWLATATTGLTHIDLDACTNQRINVFSLRDCSDKIQGVTSTPELAFGLILSLLRNIPAAHNSVVEDARWDRDSFRGSQIKGKCLGIVGLGRTGKRLATYAEAFDMEVIAYDPYIDDEDFGQAESVTLDELLGRADIVSIHVVLNDETTGMIGTDELSRLKPGAYIVNTSRGQVVDEDALTSALRSGHVAGVGTDVLCSENTDRGIVSSPLYEAAVNGLPVVITPHIGGCTLEAMQFTEQCLAEFVMTEIASRE